MRTHTIITYLLSSLLVSIFSGAAVYLAFTAVREPLLLLDYRGGDLLFYLAGEQWIVDLSVPERAAQSLQNLWFFLPARVRLLLQTVTLLFGQI